MKTKWYLSTLILILAVLGISQKQNYVPNQEIVVQFSDEVVTVAEAQDAIAIVKEQLQSIGVDNIQVHESTNGSLKISYYSDIDVAGIQKIFSQEKELVLGYTAPDQDKDPSQFPLHADSNSYQLNVCEIQNSYDVGSDFNGFLVELTPVNERLSKPDVYFSAAELVADERSNIEKTAYLVQRNIALLVDNDSHNIPEVRAGPLAHGIF